MKWPIIFIFLHICLSTLAHKDSHRHPRSVKQTSDKKQIIDTENEDFWHNSGQKEIEAALNVVQNPNVAKNIIIFIGDGMSLSTVTAARIYKGQQQAKENQNQKGGLAEFDGNSAKLSWESFPNVGLSMTYNSDYMVSDSASTAFAMYSGVKTTGYTMGYDNSIKYLDISSTVNATEVETILDWAQRAGKKTGFVTTTRMTHATPAALYSKTASRFWECEKEIWDDINEGNTNQDEYETYNPPDIAQQLMEFESAKKIDVMFGGGRASFLPKNDDDTRWDYDNYDWDCYRLDGRNLIDEWKGNNTNGKYVENKDQLNALTMKEDKVLGIFSNSYVYWDHEVEENSNNVTLEMMASKAVQFLQAKDDGNGYFIMIEAGRIDQAHHNGRATAALSETVALDKAVASVMDLLDARGETDETLVLVTADHSHTMTIGGYTGRFHDITANVEDPNGFENLADDGNSLSILSYGNGPGFKQMNTTGDGTWEKIKRKLLADRTAADVAYKQPSAQPIGSETHGGDDVGIWATGPMSHLVHGVHQQSYIAHVMAYSACIGPHDNLKCRLRMASGAQNKSLSFTALALLFISIWRIA